MAVHFPGVQPLQAAESDYDGCSAGCGCGIDRREFLRLAGVTSTVWLAAQLPVMAGPFAPSDFERLVPADKRLHPDWVKSLFDRGTRAVYRGADLEKIGMPVGGLCAGQLYLGGDGKLWHWDIFNRHHDTGSSGPHYANPMEPSAPLDQGFALRITASGKTETRALDRTGFSDVSFCGEYPIGMVEYQDPAAPVAVSLEAFSPFIPLVTEDSSLPATILRYTVRNTSSGPVEVTLAGWLENAVCLYNRWQPGMRRNRIVRGEGFTVLDCSVERPAEPAEPPRPDVLFEEWRGEKYDGWTVEGTAFGRGPVKRSEVLDYQGHLGGEGEQVVNSHASAPAGDVVARDGHTGKLTSRRFTIERHFINVWIGGGAHEGKTCLNLVVDGKLVRSLTGANNNRMSLQTIGVHRLHGREAFLEIVDAERGPWGNIGVGRITFSDRPAVVRTLEELPDYGTMSLALLGSPAEHALAAAEKGGFAGRGDRREAAPGEASADLEDRLIGAIGRKQRLATGQSTTVEFVLTWHFPNLELPGLGTVGRSYAARFDSARAVARYVVDHRERLTSQTRLWRDTWYDSTLPRWFLDRTFLNSSILATSTCFRFANGRFYGWEGVGCCAGTCTHVWHYAHAPARLFPELERTAREMVDYGVAFEPDTGRIRFRAEHNDHWAVDGQAGCILRACREHQMSADDRFLRRLWPRVKKSLEFLISKDSGADGIIDGAQHNTLDADWFGQVAWLSSLYVAALRAGEAMATEVGDAEFARKAGRIADAGSKSIDAKLFNGEYYLQLPDPQHPKSVGSYDGCEIDQVFGQSWAHQVGLGWILPEAHVKNALASLWRYNFTPDVGPYRAAHKPGRWYAMAGEGGLIMGTWPRGDAARVSQAFDYYFNECMTGFEYQVAGHMLREGMLLEGLAVTRAIHDRYHASRRNPWNEIECGDHYARAMASYGVYLAACGCEYHGPKGHLAFGPRLTQESFKAAFTAAEGWGSYAQKTDRSRMNAKVALRWGQLRLKTLALALPAGVRPRRLQVTLEGRAVPATSSAKDRRVLVTLGEEVVVKAGQMLTVKVG
jgi:non-lysosomal glucosylceramidase